MTGWIPRAYLKILGTGSEGPEVDAFVTNFVYEKEGQSRRRVWVIVSLACPTDFGWDPGPEISQKASISWCTFSSLPDRFIAC